MAECHPVGFQWVMEAKARGATIIHIDPRFTRTSAMADTYVPLRAGSDIAFLGGIVNYILSEEKYFREYVVSYTNAATIVSEDFQDADRARRLLLGLRSGDRHLRHHELGVRGHGDCRRGWIAHRPGPADERRREGRVRWPRRGPAPQRGPAGRDPRGSVLCLSDPQTPLRAVHTRDGGAICGVPPDQFARVCEAVTANSGRERTTAWVYSVGWTQHSVGVQYIRGAAIIQLLLGNMGRPGGGILALAATRASRGRPISRPFSTSFPATCPCRSRCAQEPQRVPRRRSRARARRVSGPRRRIHGQPPQGMVGRRRHRRKRLRLRVAAPDQRRSQQLPDDPRHARRQGRGLFPARSESCRGSANGKIQRRRCRI